MISIIASSAPGLSPLMRGTHMNVGSDRVFTRFIPAGAGNTVLDHFKFTIDSVYPRWRGEHCNSLISDLPRLGLSPLARGTPVPGRGCISILRFIPAGAGNTRWIRVLHSTAAVYPRWRGEHSSCNSCANSISGLSPLARGTQISVPASSVLLRFIPAGAGNTLSIHNCF